MQVGGKDYSQFYEVASEQPFDFVGRLDDIFHREILAGIQLFHHFPYIRLEGRCKDGSLYIAHFGRDGKAEKDNLYNRHAYQYQHGTPVAQDMVKFFSDKSDKLFHGCSVCV